VAFVAAVPLLVTGVFFLPRETRLALALLYTEPSILTSYASHFVHLDLPHILANLLVYTLVVPFSLVVSIKSGRRRRFYIVAITVLLAFPFVLSGLNLLFPRPRIGFGLSGINMAFVGYLPHVLASHLESERLDTDTLGETVLQLGFFLGTTVIALRVALSLQPGLSAGSEWLLAAGVGSALASILFARPIVASLRAHPHSVEEFAPPTVLFGGALFVLLVLIGFPQVSVTDGSVVNVFLHLLGYSLGYLTPYVTFRVLGVDIKALRRYR